MLSGSVLQFVALLLRGCPVLVLPVYGPRLANIQRSVPPTVAARRRVGREAGHTGPELATIKQEAPSYSVTSRNPQHQWRIPRPQTKRNAFVAAQPAAEL
jgi:hypothetical protein